MGARWEEDCRIHAPCNTVGNSFLTIHDPIKDKQRRDVSLSTFRDPEKSKTFDYGAMRFNLPKPADADDDDDMKFV